VQYVWDYKNNKQETIYRTFSTGCCLPYCTRLISCLVYIYVSCKVLGCNVVSWIVCRVIVVCASCGHLMCICCTVYLLLRCICCTVYLLYSVMCICCTVCFNVFPFNAGLLARGQYSEGPATGHLDTGLSRFPLSLSKRSDGSQHSSCHYMLLM
jgi:hypothetical protein